MRRLKLETLGMPLPPPQDTSNVVPLIKRRPGRPRIARPMPDHDEAEYVSKLSDLAQTFITTDSLVGALTDEKATNVERLEGVMGSVAQECAALLYQRENLQSESRDAVPQLCSRRVDGLMKLTSLVLQREEAVRASGELDGRLVVKLVDHLVASTEAVVREVAEPEHAEAFVASLRRQMMKARFPGGLL